MKVKCICLEKEKIDLFAESGSHRALGLDGTEAVGLASEVAKYHALCKVLEIAHAGDLLRNSVRIDLWRLIAYLSCLC